MSSKRLLQGSTAANQEQGTSIVTDTLEIRRLLSRVTEGHTAASLKPKGSEHHFRTEVLDVDPTREGLQIRFPEIPEGLTLEQVRQSIKNGECLLLIYLEGRFIVGLNGAPAEIKDDRLIFKTPTRMFKIQRRKNIRYLIPSGYEYTVEMESIEQPGTRVKKKLIDLSENGISFFVPSLREAELFLPGKIIQRCVLQIQSQMIWTSLKVCNQFPHDRGHLGTGSKIGAEFEDMSDEDQAYIAQFVYSHASHLLY